MSHIDPLSNSCPVLSSRNEHDSRAHHHSVVRSNHQHLHHCSQQQQQQPASHSNFAGKNFTGETPAVAEQLDQLSKRFNVPPQRVQCVQPQFRCPSHVASGLQTQRSRPEQEQQDVVRRQTVRRVSETYFFVNVTVAPAKLPVTLFSPKDVWATCVFMCFGSCCSDGGFLSRSQTGDSIATHSAHIPALPPKLGSFPGGDDDNSLSEHTYELPLYNEPAYLVSTASLLFLSASRTLSRTPNRLEAQFVSENRTPSMKFFQQMLCGQTSLSSSFRAWFWWTLHSYISVQSVVDVFARANWQLCVVLKDLSWCFGVSLPDQKTVP